MNSVKNIMIEEVVSVSLDTPLIEVARILAEHSFDGMPVVDKNNKLVGILTEYDLISKGSAVHLPTLQIVLQDVKVYNKDKATFKETFEEIASLRVSDVMNSEPLTLDEDATFEEAVIAFRDHHRVNPIPVINKKREVVGVVSRYDILESLYLPKT
ncbi:hypothetical protein A2641_01320 [Candidatus Nomurabacteria bacterium RIFCSPHIGHO2_01_FULL_37_25]|uniref:CBS domain-containing protein n=1 Tax=Candidatus Nomurabacteria bacterium RIFCSPLOWO2_01_FULL_36_16 TaxID=1801767 RepID=A0A1F6WYX8_9BACT|nr:MAG: hypothetical protein A2641_01320 [Candidatus Nomurabacteria bacterium RIFCSPHIGHO2_01_FULL_37_25]OGI75352.1 MAG: hypothetical protein A3D36_02220 [Candidatus Nomurabacteria bacterium RIFCSPHIGHO2_02_FULL_36_29]OGI87099.1 MAG: hypothetical protein A3A91_00315 [Candidatus Nomurabacteria bacterium RIFCSPLOWO2_01_FULL_36_16]OGI95255.1 MAG: hypothetical protein A3I84_02785 [Candidatus Nomurabacteria bacterium RIFCSPLOWO2_02_FULL_36_8]